MSASALKSDRLPVGRLIRQGSAALLKRTMVLWERWHRRSAFGDLANLEPWQLDDIGLTPADIEWGRTLPLKVDAMTAAVARAKTAREKSGRRWTSTTSRTGDAALLAPQALGVSAAIMGRPSPFGELR